MTTRNLEQFAIMNWSEHIRSVKKISENTNGVSLVDSDTKIFSFDEIVKCTFPHRDLPTSADGIDFKKDEIYVVEFKSGFKQKITKDKFDESKAKCDITKKVCGDYWGVFWENQSLKKDQLIDSIKLKAIESYMILEKHYFPQCSCDKEKKLVFIAVIDEDGVDGIEDSMAEVAGVEVKSENCFKSIKQALNRLTNRSDINGSTYLYDKVLVKSVVEYKKTLL